MSTEERQMVLKMLQEGRIGTEEAERLLSALDRAEASRRGYKPERPHPGPGIDFGEIGRGIKEAVRDFAEGLRKVAEQAPWGEDLGSWFGGAFGAAKLTAEREFVLPLEQGAAPVLLTFTGDSGRVTVQATDDDRVTGKATVRISASDGATAQKTADETLLVAEKQDDTVTVSLRSPRASDGPSPGRAHILELHLTVPRRMSLRIATASGGVSASGTAGKIELSTASGDLELSVLGGAVTARTASGDVKLRIAQDARARIEATTASGAITARAPLRVEEITRHRLVGVLNAPDVTMKLSTASGDISIESGIDKQTKENRAEASAGSDPQSGSQSAGS